jgi:teichuronic acid biosynthesis glycosyltransferase TuaG
MNTTISVIIPTYNCAPFLRQCLDSVLGQSYTPSEVIVVDDDSTDHTEQVLASYNTKIISCRIPHSGIPGVVRNVGLERAKGEFIAFCDADDYWVNDKIEQQLMILQQTNSNCCVTDAFVLGDEETTLLANHPFRSSNLRRELLRNNYFITSSVMLHRSLMRKKKFSSSKSFRGYEDYILWLSLLEELRIAYIPKPLVYYRKREQSLSNAVRSKDALIQLKILFSFPLFYRHPFLWSEKVLRYLYQLIR